MLPKINLPTYTLKIPSSGKEIIVRPFLVKEEKLLLIAVESNDDEEMIRTVKQVINNCIVSENVDIEKLPFFDIDYLFIALRAKSVGEAIEVKFTCKNIVEGKMCGNVFPASIDIANCVVITPIEKNDVILPGHVKVKMKYPNYTTMMKIESSDADSISKRVKIIISCIDQIIKDDKVYTTKDITPEELQSFIENLKKEDFAKFETFIDNFPYFVIETKSKCTKCGFEHTIHYKDFTSFLD